MTTVIVLLRIPRVPYPLLHDRQTLHEILQLHLLLADDNAKGKADDGQEEDGHEEDEVRCNIEPEEIRKSEDGLREDSTDKRHQAQEEPKQRIAKQEPPFGNLPAHSDHEYDRKYDNRDAENRYHAPASYHDRAVPEMSSDMVTFIM